MPTVSIILPTYNGEKYIKDSIESIINQTFSDWELIIVNDCSTDNTLNIANQYAKFDKRIKVVSNEYNKKLPASLNVGFSKAKGKYYTWTSDDNMYRPQAIERMVDYLNLNSCCDLISCSFDYIAENGQFIRETKNPNSTSDAIKLIHHCNIGACFMYRKEIADKVGEYDLNMFCAEDYDYWCRMAICGNIHYKDENLYQYRVNSQSLTATKKDVIKQRTMEIRLKYANDIMTKFGLSNKEKIKKIFNYYRKTQDKRWIELAYKIDKNFAKKYQLQKCLKSVIKNIFSIKNSKNKKYKIITVFHKKIKFKR
jgi:glycosyltransferase involved in cell wall biosynthesis